MRRESRVLARGWCHPRSPHIPRRVEAASRAGWRSCTTETLPAVAQSPNGPDRSSCEGRAKSFGSMDHQAPRGRIQDRDRHENKRGLVGVDLRSDWSTSGPRCRRFSALRGQVETWISAHQSAGQGRTRNRGRFRQRAQAWSVQLRLTDAFMLRCCFANMLNVWVVVL